MMRVQTEASRGPAWMKCVLQVRRRLNLPTRVAPDQDEILPTHERIEGQVAESVEYLLRGARMVIVRALNDECFDMIRPAGITREDFELTTLDVHLEDVNLPAQPLKEGAHGYRFNVRSLSRLHRSHRESLICIPGQDAEASLPGPDAAMQSLHFFIGILREHGKVAGIRLNGEDLRLRMKVPHTYGLDADVRAGIHDYPHWVSGRVNDACLRIEEVRHYTTIGRAAIEHLAVERIDGLEFRAVSDGTEDANGADKAEVLDCNPESRKVSERALQHTGRIHEQSLNHQGMKRFSSR